MASVPLPPLASIQDEWSEFVDFKATNDRRRDAAKYELAERGGSQPDKRNGNPNNSQSKDKRSNCSGYSAHLARHSDEQTDEEVDEEEFRAFEQQFEQIKQQSDLDGEPKIKVESLEELVKTFDEKIVNCFVNYEESVESMAPVQVLNPEELIAECE